NNFYDWTFKRLWSKPMLALSIIVFGLSFGSAERFTSAVINLAQQNEIFTEAQARRGQSLYQSRCASCHGVQLEGGSSSPLSGGRFMEKWGRGNHNVDELYYITRTTMPYGAGGTLSNQQYIDIIAYILKVNGYRAGAGELATDSTLLKQIKIEPQGSPKEKAFTAQSDNEAKTAKPAVDGLLPSSKLPSQEE